MTSKRAFLGISHTPLLGLNPVAPTVENPLRAAIARVGELVDTFAPELLVVIGPDHYNGFLNELMPPFCIGTEAEGIGDYGSPAGPLNVDTDAALALAEHLIGEDFDVAVSRRMRVDHGFAQPLQLLWGSLSTPPVVPLFLNAVAAPSIPRLRRCRALGAAIGRYLDTTDQRTLVIGSGGLSHEPPLPTLAHPDPAVRERITVRSVPHPDEMEARKRRAMAAGRALAAGDASMKPLNPEWDRRWMDALERSAPWDALCSISEEAITAEAGLSAHESKSWLVGRCAIGEGDIACGLRHYQAIPDYIAGFGIMWLTPARGNTVTPGVRSG